MSRRDWLQHTPLIVGVIILLALFSAPLIDHQRETERAYQAAQQEYDESKRVSPPGLTIAEGKGTDHKTYRDEWRSEQDLKAQREMADTSWWMALAAWIGVFFLAATLWETGKAAKGAADAADAAHKSIALAGLTAERELRAYVACTDVRVTEIEPDKSPAVAIVIKNSGATPAHDIRAEFSLFYDAYPQTSEMVDVDRSKLMTYLGIMDSENPVTARPKMLPVSAEQIEDIATGKQALYVVTTLVYRDIFGKWCRSRRWHMHNAETRKADKASLNICPLGHAYEYDIGEGH